ncbi:MAG TPA: hypothetical protein VF992_02850 [Thermoplasmata archaeon]
MTQYLIPDFGKASRGDYRKFQKTYRKFRRVGPSHIANRYEGSRFVIEGYAADFVDLASDFLLMCAHPSHAHLYSKTQPGGFAAPFQEGIEVTIGSLENPRAAGAAASRAITSFRYQARPAISGSRPLVEGSEAETGGDQEGFRIEGNLPALLSFAQHCLDLAEDETAAGTLIRYEPGQELTVDSFPLGLRRRDESV